MEKGAALNPKHLQSDWQNATENRRSPLYDTATGPDRKNYMHVSAGQPCEPAEHVFCMRLAYHLVGIIQPVLRPEEIAEAAREFYAAIRQDLDEYEQSKLKGAPDDRQRIRKEG
jgi:hypothetical protein